MARETASSTPPTMPGSAAGSTTDRNNCGPLQPSIPAASNSRTSTDFTPNTPKYVFTGIAEFATDAPAVITGDNYEGAVGTLFDQLLRCKVNIFNISKINSEVRGGKSPRIGNHHPSMSPWNAYRASDGWVLLCAGTNDQWRRVCELIGQPELANDARYATTTLRVRAAAEVDAIVERWTAQHTVKDCAAQLNAVSISAGPILEMRDLLHEPAQSGELVFHLHHAILVAMWPL